MVYHSDIETLADITRFHARQRPDKAALVFEGRRVSYAELDQASNRVASALIAAGLKPGDRVAHIGKNSVNYFELMFGAAKAGGVTVSVNWRLAPPEVAFVIEDAHADFVFVDEELFEVMGKALHLLKGGCRVFALSGAHADWPAFDAWRDASDPVDPMLPATADDVVYQLYTSGTTGKPKGAQITHTGVLAGKEFEREVGAWMNWHEGDVQLVNTPMFHVSGNVWTMLSLYAGATSVLIRDFIIDELLAAIEAERVTKAFFVPAMLLMVLQHPRAKATDYSSLELIYYGASPIPLDLLRQSIEVFDTGFVQLYGMTEVSGSCTYLPPEDHDPAGSDKMRSAGKPFPGVDIRIIDHAGREVPTGDVGQVTVRTPTIMKGYWNRDEATAEAIRDGWLYSGDAGYVDADGYLYIYDRVKDMIISGGENVYPAEVESALFDHPAVKDVGVIGVPSDRWGEEVKALVVRADGTDLSEQDLIAFAHERIAGYKCPKSVDFVDTLPRNPSGKLLKREMRKPYWQGQGRQVN